MNRFSLHEATIDTSAIRDNARALIGGSDGRVTVADLRADGYGHGAADAARAAVAGGATWLGVSSRTEGLELRAAGVTGPIAVLSGGVPAAIADLAPEGARCDGALVLGPDLYGLAQDSALKPAMRVSARVVATKSIRAGDGVSYGHTYRATRPTRLALVAIGYANGLDRYASNTGTVWLRGKARPIAGRVAMNVAVVELGSDETEVGDEAVIFGNPHDGEPSAAHWAAVLRKQPSEVVSAFGSHLPRRVL